MHRYNPAPQRSPDYPGRTKPFRRSHRKYESEITAMDLLLTYPELYEQICNIPDDLVLKFGDGLFLTNKFYESSIRPNIPFTQRVKEYHLDNLTQTQMDILYMLFVNRQFTTYDYIVKHLPRLQNALRDEEEKMKRREDIRSYSKSAQSVINP
jgi:hypothetical protein